MAQAERVKRWRAKHPEKVKEWKLSWYAKNKDWKRQYDRKYTLRTKFGITLEDYDNLFTKQDGMCAICENALKKGRGTHLDHCHTTKRVRGLLCTACNMALGLFKDDFSRLVRAIDYLVPEEAI